MIVYLIDDEFERNPEERCLLTKDISNVIEYKFNIYMVKVNVSYPFGWISLEQVYKYLK